MTPPLSVTDSLRASASQKNSKAFSCSRGLHGFHSVRFLVGRPQPLQRGPSEWSKGVGAGDCTHFPRASGMCRRRDVLLSSIIMYTIDSRRRRVGLANEPRGWLPVVSFPFRRLLLPHTALTASSRMRRLSRTMRFRDPPARPLGP